MPSSTLSSEPSNSIQFLRTLSLLGKFATEFPRRFAPSCRPDSSQLPRELSHQVQAPAAWLAATVRRALPLQRDA